MQYSASLRQVDHLSFNLLRMQQQHIGSLASYNLTYFSNLPTHLNNRLRPPSAYTAVKTRQTFIIVAAKKLDW